MKKLNFIVLACCISLLNSCSEAEKTEYSKNEEEKGIIGSVFWSPFHSNGQQWVGSVIYYFYNDHQCFVRAMGKSNRMGGERTGRIREWKQDGNKLIVEDHSFTILDDQVLLSNDRVFFRAENLSEAHLIVYNQ